MDIDTPIDLIPDFSTHYPLPFRVLFLSFTTLLGFATNLHILAKLGIDTALVLDIHKDSDRPPHLSPTERQPGPLAHPNSLYPPIYALAGLGLGWTVVGWQTFMWATGGEPETMVKWRIMPVLTAVVVGAACVCPWRVLYKRERMMYLSSLRRIVFGGLYSAVPFSDIILADILTSSAKVLGDVWVSGCLLFTETKRFGVGEEEGLGCARVFMVPVMTSLPYIFRFRQCLSEVATGSTPTPRRSLMNAAKYASAFPVIFFSAMQTVVGDQFDTSAETGVIGRTTLFRLWMLAVMVNSLYSFWWDVTNDWGLSLLTKAGWSSNANVGYSVVHNPAAPGGRNLALSTGAGRGSAPPNQRTRSAGSSVSAQGHSSLGVPGASAGGAVLDSQYPPPPSRPHSPSNAGTPSKHYHTHTGPSSSASSSLSASSAHAPSNSGNHHPPARAGHSRAFSTAASPNVSYPFLRPILLLPDPTFYYLAIFVDFLLRFTWSLKLSSHLHSVHEIEAGIFLMEALEVFRRWMWVYLRIEWEAVRKGGGGYGAGHDAGRHAVGEPMGGDRYADRNEDPDEEIGLGILVRVDKDVDNLV